MKYTKEFLDYYKKSSHGLGSLELWQQERLKRALFNAFKKGKTLRKKAAYTPIRSYC